MSAAELADRLAALRDEMRQLRESEQFMASFVDADPSIERQVRYKLLGVELALSQAHNEIRYHVLGHEEDHHGHHSQA